MFGLTLAVAGVIAKEIGQNHVSRDYYAQRNSNRGHPLIAQDTRRYWLCSRYVSI